MSLFQPLPPVQRLYAGEMHAGVTFFGNEHTHAEIRDLLAVKNVEHADMQAAADANVPTLAAKDPSWARDWAAFTARYAAVASPAMAKIAEIAANHPADLDDGDEPTWIALLNALKQGRETLTDGQGLFARLEKAGVSPHMRALPQPTAKDAQMQAYRTTQEIERAAAEAANAAAAKAGELLDRSGTAPTLLLALGVGIVILAIRK